MAEAPQRSNLGVRIACSSVAVYSRPTRTVKASWSRIRLETQSIIDQRFGRVFDDAVFAFVTITGFKQGLDRCVHYTNVPQRVGTRVDRLSVGQRLNFLVVACSGLCDCRTNQLKVDTCRVDGTCCVSSALEGKNQVAGAEIAVAVPISRFPK